MRQATGMRGWSGAASGELADGFELAREAYGLPDVMSPDKGDDSGLTCFAYLWRRFGPPRYGSDPHKDLCCYYLTTDDPDVVLWVRPCGSGLAYGVGYMVSKRLAAGPSPSARRRVQGALKRALRELLRPAYVRDVPINILGRCADGEPAERSKYAGLGVPPGPLDEMLRQEERR